MGEEVKPGRLGSKSPLTEDRGLAIEISSCGLPEDISNRFQAAMVVNVHRAWNGRDARDRLAICGFPSHQQPLLATPPIRVGNRRISGKINHRCCLAPTPSTSLHHPRMH